MKIRYKNYLLTLTDSRRWDFSRLVTRQRVGDGDKRNPTGESYEAEEILGYDMQMESVIKDIIILETENKFKDETIDLKIFLEGFEESKNELIKIFKEQFKIEVK